MTTLMSWGNSEGTQGRCDAKCHNAREPECKCMCGGRYHGAAGRPGGVEKAVADFWEETFERAKERAEAEGLVLTAISGEGAAAVVELLNRKQGELLFRFGPPETGLENIRLEEGGRGE